MDKKLAKEEVLSEIRKEIATKEGMSFCNYCICEKECSIRTRNIAPCRAIEETELIDYVKWEHLVFLKALAKKTERVKEIEKKIKILEKCNSRIERVTKEEERLRKELRELKKTLH